MPEADKTQKPTSRRRKKAREQGQVVRSRELGSVLALAGVAPTLSVLSTGLPSDWVAFYHGVLTAACQEDLTADGPVLFWTAIEVLRWTVPVLLVAMFVSVGVGLAQGGISFSPAALTPKAERLNPGARLDHIFSLVTLSNVLKSLLPFGAIAALGITAIKSHWNDLILASGEDIHALVMTLGEIIGSVAWKAALVLLVWSGVDYLTAWQQNESKLRMSHDEVRREHRESDGNPATKVRIRKQQRAMRRRKPLQAAASATLVITNPTHFAVALRYEHSMKAPEVVAKGRDLLAQQIKAIAQENNIPLIENKALARTLHDTVEVGQSIPAELYQAVAEILVVVFRAQAEVREQESARGQRDAAGEVIKSR